MTFRPPFCPYTDCVAHTTRPFTYQRRGRFRRKCDGLIVQRFGCRTCGRRFSTQSFRINYRWWKPRLHLDIVRDFVSKVTMRQIARMSGAARSTVARRLRSLGAHCSDFHRAALSRAGLTGVFALDELETFETDRLLCPVTVPVVVQVRTLFVVHAETAPLAPRGRLDAVRTLRKQAREARFGKRTSGSKQAVESTLLRLRDALAPGATLNLRSDRKATYRSLVQLHFRDRFGGHVRISSRRKRDKTNPLFPINHTLAMLHDGVSRLVRRSWAVSKLRGRLEDHLWIWIAYRNYVRGITVKETRRTPAMAAGVLRRQLGFPELFYWRWPSRMPMPGTSSG